MPGSGGRKQPLPPGSPHNLLKPRSHPFLEEQQSCFLKRREGESVGFSNPKPSASPLNK